MAKKENKILNSEGKTKTGTKNHKNVEISFYYPEATNAYVAGELNGWEIRSLPMSKDKDGLWRSKIKLLAGGYEYKFFADDSTWIEKLPGAEAIPNPFGTQNFTIWVR